MKKKNSPVFAFTAFFCLAAALVIYSSPLLIPVRGSDAELPISIAGWGRTPYGDRTLPICVTTGIAVQQSFFVLFSLADNKKTRTFHRTACILTGTADIAMLAWLSALIEKTYAIWPCIAVMMLLGAAVTLQAVHMRVMADKYLLQDITPERGHDA